MLTYFVLAWVLRRICLLLCVFVTVKSLLEKVIKPLGSGLKCSLVSLCILVGILVFQILYFCAEQYK